MSDYEDNAAASRSLSPEYAPTNKTLAASRKRKSDASGATRAIPKKARTSKAKANAEEAEKVKARDLVAAVLADTSAYSDDVVTLAKYARSMEGTSAKKTEKEIEEAVEKIRKAAYSGIKSQMKWRPSCKEGVAKWSYDGYCPDPEVFGRLLGLDGPPNFKMKKFTIDEFSNHIGDITASARYNDLRITTNVNVRFSPESGEFKFSGSYGV